MFFNAPSHSVGFTWARWTLCPMGMKNIHLMLLSWSILSLLSNSWRQLIANKKFVCSPALEMRRFVDGVSMNFVRFISCGIQAVGLAWTNLKDAIRVVLLMEARIYLERSDADDQEGPGISSYDCHSKTVEVWLTN